jgi:ribosomal protein S18 acetylase RimI-like enzyme
MEKDHTAKIRRGGIHDIHGISRLNAKWQVAALAETDKQNGFLIGGAFTQADLEKIVAAEEFAVLEASNEVVGYYLCDNYSETSSNWFKLCEQKFKRLEGENLLASKRLCKRVQTVIDSKFQNQGYSKKLLDFLTTTIIKDKYDLLFSVVAKKNPKIDVHVKGGWRIIAHDDDVYYVVYDLREK